MRAALLLFASLLYVQCSAQTTITTFVLVRHAEKASDGTQDPDLTPEGRTRAQNLAALLAKEKISAIYSTAFKRTTQTVAPLAAATGLSINTYEPFKAEAIEAMVRQHAGGTVVISGHSNTIPWTANLLLGQDTFTDYEEGDYGNLLLVTVVEKGKTAKVTWLRY